MSRRLGVCVTVAIAAVAGTIAADAAAKRIDAPRSEAALTGSSVLVSVRDPQGPKATSVLLNGRSVKSSLHAQDGHLTGRVTRRSGLSYGRNELVVSELSGKTPVVRDVQQFFLLHRNNGFVGVTLAPGAPLRAQIRVRTRPTPNQPAQMTGMVRVWLNGVEVTKDVTELLPGSYTVSLSPTEGLRFGTNRLRIVVTQLDTGRQASIERRVQVARDEPLASAGQDGAAQPGERIRLGGSAEAAHPGSSLRFRWVLVRRPRGSHTEIVGADQAHPTIVPDKPGDYVVRQTVTEMHVLDGSTRQLGGTATDEVDYTAGSGSPLLPVSVNAFATDPRGIWIGDRYYHHVGDGATIQWLTVDRATLDPIGEGNAACCADAGKLEKSLDGLTAAIGHDDGRLVIIAIPPHRVTLGPGGDGLDKFNKALAMIGVEPLTMAEFADADRQTAIVGIPGAPLGTGWIWERSTAQNAPDGRSAGPTQGWLMADGSSDSSSRSLLLRFQPLRLKFDTHSLSPSSPTQNTMTFGGHTTSVASVPSGTGGFQVVEVDPHDLSFSEDGDRTFVTNGIPAAQADENLDAMAAFLDGIHANGQYAAVQSIGNVGYRTREWGSVSLRLSELGANPHGFNFLDPDKAGSHYAFFGGPPLTRQQMAQSSSNLPGTADGTFQDGALSGHAVMGHDGFFAPASEEEEIGAGGEAYDDIFTPATPWPETTGPDAPAYAKALAYISANLKDFKRRYPTDVRKAYVDHVFAGLGDSAFTDSRGEGRGDLYGIPYPDASMKPCAAGEGTDLPFPSGYSPEPPVTTEPFFTRLEFCTMVKELASEFEDWDNVQTLFTRYDTALERGKDASKVDLVAAGEEVKNAVNPSNLELVSELGYLFNDIGEVGGAEGGPFGLFATMFSIGSYIASDGQGEPISEQISTKVDDLAAAVDADVEATQETMDSVRAAAVSDYGRLEAVGQLSVDSLPNQRDLTDGFKVGSARYFYTTLMRLGYVVWQLKPLSPAAAPDPMSPAQCFINGDRNPPAGHTWDSVPDSAWIAFRTAPQGEGIDFETLVLARNNVFGEGSTPPAEITDRMFGQVIRTNDPEHRVVKLGIEKSQYFWESGDPVRTSTCFLSGSNS